MSQMQPESNRYDSLTNAVAKLEAIVPRIEKDLDSFRPLVDKLETRLREGFEKQSKEITSLNAELLQEIKDLNKGIKDSNNELRDELKEQRKELQGKISRRFSVIFFLTVIITIFQVLNLLGVGSPNKGAPESAPDASNTNSNNSDKLPLHIVQKYRPTLDINDYRE